MIWQKSQTKLANQNYIASTSPHPTNVGSIDPTNIPTLSPTIPVIPTPTITITPTKPTVTIKPINTQTPPTTIPLSSTPIPPTQVPPTNTPIPSCVHNTNPTFTNHFTDITKINYIAPPPTIGSGPSLKTHSYIGTDHALVPIYAPTAMKLVSGAYYVGGPYTLEFQVSCEVTLRFGHVTDPIDLIKNVFPSQPASDSRTFAVTPINFNAGDVVAYTTGTDQAGNWDFGVYNSATTNRYAADPSWNTSTVYTTAVCPFMYYSPSMKSTYYNLFNNEILGGNPPDGESFCQ